MATYSGVLDWRISWTEEPGGLQYIGSQRIGHDLVTKYKHIKSSIHLTLSFTLFPHLLHVSSIKELGIQTPEDGYSETLECYLLGQPALIKLYSLPYHCFNSI